MKRLKRFFRWLFNITPTIRHLSDEQLEQGRRAIERRALFDGRPPSEYAAICDQDGEFDKVIHLGTS